MIVLTMTAEAQGLEVSAHSKKMTLVAEFYRKNRRNHRILFGSPVKMIRRGWRRKFAAFEPDQIFGYERWTGNKYGTQNWSILIGRTLSEPSSQLAEGVTPGVDILLYVKGKIQVLRTLAVLDIIRGSSSELDDISPARWRMMHNLIISGGDPAYLLASWL